MLTRGLFSNSLLFIGALLVYSIQGFSQLTLVHQGHCKKSEIEIISGKNIPVGHVVMQIGTLDKNEVKGSLNELSKKQINTMKKYASWRKCCKVFIAFDPIQTFTDMKPGADHYNDKVCFYVLALSAELETVK